MLRILLVVLVITGSSVLSPFVFAAKTEPWLLWQPADQNNAAVIDHSDWQHFLDVAVIRDEVRQLNRVRYHALTVDQRMLLNEYLAALQSTDPRKYSRPEQMAYWINLYNALTVKVVLDHPEEDSIRDMGRGWLGKGWFSSGPWQEPVAVVAGQPLTLDDIEHRILRPLWQDHRVHYAVNCASIGCPDLATSPYTGANMDDMLNTAEQAYIGSPRGVLFNEQGGLTLSSLFDWYLQDFAENEQGLLVYLADHSDDPVATRLRGYDGKISYSYDWALNSSD